MSLTYKDSTNAIPIAKIKGNNKIIYLLSNSTTYNRIDVSNKKAKCPYCKRELSSKTKLQYHLIICDKKNHHIDTMPYIKLREFEFLENLPLPLEEHSVIICTGPPKCGKTYWVNEYVKMFKHIFDLPVFRISRVDHDETLRKEEKNYLNVPVDGDMVANPLKLEDFHDSLVIFDDIESSEFPKATKMAYNLLDDMCKNGRHHRIAVIFCNQEARMGVKTKPILSTVTTLVIFPQNCSLYQIERLLKEHVGMSKAQIKDALNLNTRWEVISKASPQYVMHEHGCYLLGKELY
jgi:uncharacterized protein with PIN domain